MVEHQLRRRGSFDERVLEAMARVPRERFVPEDLRHLAYEDGALPIGSGQTISQPFMVATICQLLGLTGDERVLDVGTGSGYQAAVLAELAARRRDHRARSRARGPCAVGTRPGGIRRGRGSRRRRLARSSRAGALRRRSRSRRQLRRFRPHSSSSWCEGGRLVVPRGGRWGQRLVLVERTENGARERTSVSCRFVPLVGEEGFSGGGS